MLWRKEHSHCILWKVSVINSLQSCWAFQLLIFMPSWKDKHLKKSQIVSFGYLKKLQFWDTAYCLYSPPISMKENFHISCLCRNYTALGSAECFPLGFTLGEVKTWTSHTHYPELYPQSPGTAGVLKDRQACRGHLQAWLLVLGLVLAHWVAQDKSALSGPQLPPLRHDRVLHSPFLHGCSVTLGKTRELNVSNEVLSNQDFKSQKSCLPNPIHPGFHNWPRKTMSSSWSISNALS